MGKVISNVKSFVLEKKNFLTNLYLGASMVAINSCAVSALTATTAQIEGADQVVSSMLGIILAIARYIGILLAVWGVIQLMLAFKNEDADSKSRSMMLIVASIALISAQSIVNTLLGSIG